MMDTDRASSTKQPSIINSRVCAPQRGGREGAKASFESLANPLPRVHVNVRISVVLYCTLTTVEICKCADLFETSRLKMSASVWVKEPAPFLSYTSGKVIALHMRISNPCWCSGMCNVRWKPKVCAKWSVPFPWCTDWSSAWSCSVLVFTLKMAPLWISMLKATIIC